MNDIADLIERLGLAPHPEGGFYRETFRSSHIVHHPTTGAVRAASTSILFLLTPGTFSAFHRLQSDEVWHYYGGDPTTLHLLIPDSGHAARCLGESYSLCGCTVAPGFEFEDFELAGRSALAAAFPACREVVEAFTRE